MTPDPYLEDVLIATETAVPLTHGFPTVQEVHKGIVKLTKTTGHLTDRYIQSDT